jgi:hypothetical protein
MNRGELGRALAFDAFGQTDEMQINDNSVDALSVNNTD